ncbi:hypothetical protein BU17DRAFT_82610 [Hysterangium stoloniferum]|nr:hypothetical protein BU17DRAFT_82610 [Hysterangium stoloniferum]
MLNFLSQAFNPLSRLENTEKSSDDGLGVKVLADGVNPTVDIVAIHGLEGHREQSWTAANGVLWLRDLLPNVLPQARILTYGYDAHMINHAKYPESILQEYAENFIARLARFRTTADTRERPIIFVAHSLGGIVLKSALIHASLSGQRHLFDHKQIYLSTYGIIFLGTPHQGTEIACTAVRMLKLSSIFSKNNRRLLQYLTTNSETLQQQQSHYIGISLDFKTKFCYEEYKTPLVGGITQLIVPRASAVIPGTTDAEPIGLHADHLEIAKFPSADGDDFRVVAESLREMADKASPVVKSKWTEFQSGHTET